MRKLRWHFCSWWIQLCLDHNRLFHAGKTFWICSTDAIYNVVASYNISFTTFEVGDLWINTATFNIAQKISPDLYHFPAWLVPFSWILATLTSRASWLPRAWWSAEVDNSTTAGLVKTLAINDIRCYKVLATTLINVSSAMWYVFATEFMVSTTKHRRLTGTACAGGAHRRSGFAAISRRGSRSSNGRRDDCREDNGETHDQNDSLSWIAVPNGKDKFSSGLGCFDMALYSKYLIACSLYIVF